MSIPEIRSDHGIPTLYVDGKPFFARAGEIHNSSSSSLDFMAEKVWPALRGLNMNAVIVPLSWETIEPVEGQFQFDLLDGLIEQARAEDMHIAFLWFGLWKNAESMYVPGWMKRNTETYFRAEKVTGERIDTISPLCAAAVEKDALAFSKVMARIRETDADRSTVIFMQVENEIGLLGTERDYSAAANEAFAKGVPAELAKALNVSGSWADAFGADAEEAFMAWHFASAVETITRAGQKEYPLPCYTNAWLKQCPWYPGSYPSGGPVRGMHPVWKAAAPSLFTLAPDIYVPYVANVMDEYGYEGNPLVIPEVRKDAVAASYCLYAFGAHNAICFSPFGVEDLILPPDQQDIPPMEVMAALNIDPSAFDISGSRDYLARAYGLVRDMEPLYLQWRGTEHLKCFVRKSDTDYGAFLRLQNYDITVAYAPKQSGKPLGAGIIFELSSNTFLMIGTSCTLTFRPKAGVNKKVSLLRLEEGELENGRWVSGRILNGDEKMSVRFGEMPSCLRAELFEY